MFSLNELTKWFWTSILCKLQTWPIQICPFFIHWLALGTVVTQTLDTFPLMNCSLFSCNHKICRDIQNVLAAQSYFQSNKQAFYLRPQTCEYGHNCPKAHSEEELKEWMMRAAEEREIRNTMETEGFVSYNQRLLEEYTQSSNEEYIVSMQL